MQRTLTQAAGVSGSDGQAEQSAAATDPGADTLTGIEHFYAASDNVGPEIDAQLAKIVSGFVTTRLPDDKLKEKLTACLAPKNCAGIVSPRVNPEIWEKLSTPTKSRDVKSCDVKSQHTQNALVGAIAEIAVTANTLVRCSRSGDPLSGPEMGTALTSLLDALALLGNVNLDMNQRRRDDQRGDINNAYKGLYKDGADGSATTCRRALTTLTGVTRLRAASTKPALTPIPPTIRIRHFDRHAGVLPAVNSLTTTDRRKAEGDGLAVSVVLF